MTLLAKYKRQTVESEFSLPFELTINNFGEFCSSCMLFSLAVALLLGYEVEEVDRKVNKVGNIN